MAEYQCHPLWDVSGSGPASNLDPAGLPLPDDLVAHLNAWAGWFNETLHPDNPVDSGFEDPQEHRAFVAEGERLAERVARAVGSDVTVVYFDDVEQRGREIV